MVKYDRLIRLVLSGYTIFTIAFFIYLPIAVIYIYSVNDTPYFIPEWRGFTLEWFMAAFRRRDLINSLYNSVLIAIFVTAVSMAIAIPPSFYIVRSRGRIKNIFLLYMMIPFVIPWIIIGISSYIFYWYIGMPKSLLTAALSHIVYSIPLVVTLLAPRLYTMDPDIENASMDLGADPIQTFRYIVFPQIFPAMLSAAVITFAWSFDNFIISYYTLGDELTWPVWVFSILGKVPRIMPVINAVSVIIITVSSIALYIVVKKGLVRLI